MRYLKRYKKFESVTIDFNDQNLSDLLESLTVWENSLLSSIKAKEENMEEILKYVRKTTGKISIEDISNDTNFVTALSNLKLRKSEIQNTEDFETFMKTKLKFMSIYGIDDNDLSNPTFLLVQSENNPVKMYRVNDDIKKFYDKLSSKTIEIMGDDKDNFIYTTSNGNDWKLKGKEEKGIFKRFLTKEDLREMSNRKEIKINII